MNDNNKIASYVVPHCPQCKGVTFKHLHDSPYGMKGAHMNGSERFICQECGNSIYARDGKKLGFKFILD